MWAWHLVLLLTSPRQLGGSWEGKVKISPDFDKPDEEISASFYFL